MQVLRSIEDEAQKGEMDVLRITAHRDIALFILNHKRTSLADIESRYGLTIILHSDDSLIAPDYRVEREGFQGKSQPRQNGRQNHRQSKKTTHSNDNTDNDSQTDEANGTTQISDDAPWDEDQPKRRRRGRRGGRRRRGKRSDEDNQQIEISTNDDAAANDTSSENADDVTKASRDDDAKPKKAARAHGRGRGAARNSDLENEQDGSVKTETSEASNDLAPEAGANTASRNSGAAGKKKNSPSKPVRKKTAKKLVKKSSTSDDDGSDGAKAVKADAKKPVRGRKPKVKSQADADGSASIMRAVAQL